jgi:hypothetical protein
MRTSLILFSFFVLSFLLNIGYVNAEFCGLTDPSMPEPETEENNIIYVWGKVDNTEAYKCYDKHEVSGKLKIRKRYSIVKGNYFKRHGKKKWSLLFTKDREGKSKAVGWVSHDNLLFNKFPLRNNDTHIYEKALIREGDMNTERGVLAALRIFKDPELTKYEETGIEVRTVFYVYDYYPRSVRHLQSSATKSLLVSPVSFLSGLYETEPLLIGWIDRSKVTFWNTRTGCEFPVGSAVELIHDNGATENFNQNNKPLPYDSLRNPILEEKDNNYRIGAFARLGEKQLDIKRRLGKIRTGLEVLFVIDGTRSMTKAFKDTLKGVEKVADSLQYQSIEHDLEQPRFGVGFYRDEPTRSPVKKENETIVKANHPDCTQETRIYGMGNIRKFKKTIGTAIACDSDSTAEESVYLGLVRSLDEAGFIEGHAGHAKRLRMVIHIGDAGDNDRKEFNPEQIAKILEKHGIHGYIATDVSGNPDSGFKESVEPVVTEFKRIKENSKFINNPYDLSKSVSDNLNEFWTETKRAKDQIDIISRGFAGTTEGSAGVFSKEILNRAKEIIKAHNIDITGYNIFQKYVEGRVNKNTPLRISVFVSKTDIETMTSFLTQLIETERIQDKEKVWERLLKIIIGEDTCTDHDGNEMSLKDCNKMRNGIPIKAGFMKYTKKEFLNLGDAQRKEVICDAKIVRESFRFLLKDKKPDKIIFNNKDLCDFVVRAILDLNGDGLVIKDGQVSKEDLKTHKLKFIRQTNNKDSHLIDKYFFIEEGNSVAWIPFEHLGDVKQK